MSECVVKEDLGMGFKKMKSLAVSDHAILKLQHY